MKFAHLADLHIGSFRDPKLSDLGFSAFITAIDTIIEKRADFILISGDLFNTSLPAIDKLKKVVEKFKKLKDLGISIYIIAGSHDFSPSGKTMLDVLESAGLCKNVVKGEIINKKLQLKFTIDYKTGAKITGMLGKKGMLEKKYYEDMDKTHLEEEPGFKIFMFHTALSELKSKELSKMDSSPISFLPKRFSYYAGGHVHENIREDIDGYGTILYPGPIFPNNFKEIEKLKHGGFYFYDDSNPSDKISFIPIIKKEIHSINLNCDQKTTEEIELILKNETENGNFAGKIITLRLTGTLKAGKISNINFKDTIRQFYNKGAFFVMKNTSQLNNQTFEEIKINEDSVEKIEEQIIKEHIGTVKNQDLTPIKEMELTNRLIQILNQDKNEGERNLDFETRIINNLNRIFELN